MGVLTSLLSLAEMSDTSVFMLKADTVERRATWMLTLAIIGRRITYIGSCSLRAHLDYCSEKIAFVVPQRSLLSERGDSRGGARSIPPSCTQYISHLPLKSGSSG
ncbi:hypothetical protein FA13DRAFT_1727184 [Coprinellus micaceus]|uniref:Uncharacterized protein n=1 Tax=Coprinellus micaceus TaxID=71717 RepID=A0A4Y7TSE7_COPMI|nr:hypothetical protein FA13DRAFT_1727184 [Coprinellus micaceus]